MKPNEPIPEWVRTNKDETQLYREYMLMDKDAILKRQWEIQDKLKKLNRVALFCMIFLGLLAIMFEWFWILSVRLLL
jgi:hypothetical protein